MPPQSRNRNAPSPTRLSSHRTELLTSPHRRDLHSWRNSLGAERNEGKQKVGTYSSWSADPVSRSTGSHEGHKEPYPHFTHPHSLTVHPHPQRSVLLPHIVGSHTRGPLSWRGLQRRHPNWSTPEHWPEREKQVHWERWRSPKDQSKMMMETHIVKNFEGECLLRRRQMASGHQQLAQ